MAACPYCAEPVDAGAARCPWCGSALRPDAPPATAPFAWDDLGRGLWRRWWETWKASHFQMDAFFRDVPTQGGHGSPLKYYVLNQALCLPPTLCFMSLYFWAVAVFESPRSGGMETAFMVGAIVVQLLVAIPLAIVGLYVWTCISHLCAKMLGSPAPFERTFRLLSFAGGSIIWSVIPFIGGLVAWVVSIIMYVYGYRHLHGFTTGKAVAAALLPWAAVIILCCGGYAVFIAAIFMMR
jgi:hypothetical protein